MTRTKTVKKKNNMTPAWSNEQHSRQMEMGNVQSLAWGSVRTWWIKNRKKDEFGSSLRCWAGAGDGVAAGVLVEVWLPAVVLAGRVT
jgi:hypothetical protein